MRDLSDNKTKYSYTPRVVVNLMPLSDISHMKSIHGSGKWEIERDEEQQ